MLTEKQRHDIEQIAGGQWSSSRSQALFEDVAERLDRYGLLWSEIIDLLGDAYSAISHECGA